MPINLHFGNDVLVFKEGLQYSIQIKCKITTLKEEKIRRGGKYKCYKNHRQLYTLQFWSSSCKAERVNV